MPQELLVVRTGLNIARAPAEVFEAIVNPEKMKNYFISSGTGRLEAGKTVTWRWEDANAQAPVEATKIESGRLIAFNWGVTGNPSAVEITLEPVGATKTKIAVSESGWEGNADGIARYGQQMQGWVHFMLCLKAYLEYGINLRGDPPAK